MVKESACQCRSSRRRGLDPSGRCPHGGNGSSLNYSLKEMQSRGCGSRSAWNWEGHLEQKDKMVQKGFIVEVTTKDVWGETS